MANERSKTKTAANAIGFTVAVIVAVILFNIIGNRYFTRLDFTKERIYTLSQPSKDLVQKLPDKVTIKAFISGDLQPPFSQTAQYVRDLLDEYATASKGKVKWEAIDPGTDAKLEEEATKANVPKMRRGRVSSNKLEIGSSYLGISIQYQGNTEAIPEINAPEGLEFEIDKRIKKLAFKKPKIAFAASEGELSFQGDPRGGGGGGLQLVKQFLDYYDVVPVQLNQGAKPLADDVDGLIIAGPKQPFSERAKFVVDQFLMKGKAVAFFVDGMVIESPHQMQMPGQETPKIGRKNDTGLDDLLEHYGFKIHNDVVLDRKNVPGPASVQGRMALVNSPVFLATDTVAKSSPIMENVPALVLPVCSSVEVIKDKQAGLMITQLASSSEHSWRQKDFFLFDPTAPVKPGDDKGPFPLAYAAEGKLKSFFAGKPYPNEKGEKVQPAANVSLPPGEEKPLDEGTASARLLIVGNSAFINDEYLQVSRYIPTYQVDLLFFTNAVDYLSQDKSLQPIRAKGMTARPITVGSDTTPTLIRYANVVGVPLAFILYGIARQRLRSSRRARAKLPTT